MLNHMKHDYQVFHTRELNDIITSYIDNYCDMDNPSFNCEAYGCRVEYIESEPYNGFIPFTDGGVGITWLSDLALAHGTGNCPEYVADYIDKQIERCINMYAHDYPSNIGDNEQPLPEYEEHYFEYQNDWLIDSFHYTLRIVKYNADNARNRSGKDEYFIFTAINLSEYGDDRSNVIMQSHNVPYDEMTPEKLEEILSGLSWGNGL